MRYDKYVNKMKTALATRKFISRNKIIIMIVSAVVLVLTLSLLFTAGVVTKIEVPNEFVYGEEIEVKGSALFKKVYYEYLYEGSEEWTDVEPTVPGTYQVRVASKKLIGKTSYSKPVEFVIKPKEVLVSVVAETIEFGNKPNITAELEEGDYFAAADFVYENYASNKTTATVIIESIVVHNQEGKDVTGAYTFSANSGEVNFTSRGLTVSVPSVSKVYDGTPLTSNTFEVDGTGLIEGHVGVLTTDASITNVGTVKNNISSFKIMDNELDVASNYNIDYKVGNLTIEKRPILVVTSSKTKEYDGNGLISEEFEISSSSYGLVEGHVAKVISSTSITKAGKCDNVLEIEIYDANNNNVTENYDISYEYGELIVDKLQIGITTPSDNKLYDGALLANTNFEYTLNSKQVLTSHKLEIIDYAQITNVGKVENIITLKVVDDFNNDVTENYNIVYTNGTLVINSKDITVKTPSAQKAYDGEKLEALDFEVEGIYSTFSVELVESTSITEVGEVTNKILVKVLDEKKNDVTDKFAINYEYGKLKVIPQTVYISLVPQTKVYDGTSLTSTIWNYSYDNEFEFIENAKVTIMTSGEITKVGEVANKLSGYKILYNNKDITNCYTIQAYPSTLTVTEREVTVDINNVDKVYDGTALTSDSYTVISETKVVRGEILTITTGASVTYVNEGTIENAMTSYKVVNGNNEDVSSCYKIIANPGTLKINTIEVSITIVSKEKVYDGTELESNEWIYTPNTTGRILEDETKLSLTMSGSITYYTSENNGVIENAVTGYSLFIDNKELKDNYSFTFIPGTLSIIQKNIEIKVKDATKPYDGTPLTSNDYEFINDTGLVDGDVITVETNGSVTYVNDKNIVNAISNHKIINKDEEDVTNSYKLTSYDGTLIITPRNINIVIKDKSKVYDGTPLTSSEWEYAIDTVDYILEDDTKLSLTMSGSITYYTSENNGVTENDVTDYSLIIDGKELKSNYVIKATPGTLTITQLQVQIKVDDVINKVYDGSEVRSDKFTFIGGNVVSNDKLTITTDGVAKNVTATPVVNNMTSYKVVNSGGLDISKSYIITANPGYIDINKADITISTVSAGKIYDGLPFYNEDNYEKILVNNVKDFGNGVIEYIEIHSYNEEMILRNTYLNEVTVKIVDKDGNETTSNYNLIEDFGYITIADKIIEVDIKNLVKEYDGLPYFNDDNLNIISDFFETLPSDEEVVINLSQELNIGTYDARDFISIDIIDENDNSLLNNYGIVILGTVTITEKEINLKSFDGTKIYDGLPYFDDYKLSLITNAFANLPAGESVEVVFNNNPINVGEYNASDIVNINVIKDSSINVTSNYNFDISGYFTIYQKQITINRHNQIKEYDGLPYYSEDIIKSIEDNIVGLPSGEKLEINLLNNPSNIGVYTDLIKLEEIDIIKDGVSTKANYNIVISKGTITINKKQIIVTTISDSTKEYDGLAYDSLSKVDLSTIVVVDGHTVELDNDSINLNIIDAGTYTNTMKIVIKDSVGNLVTSNYEIDYKYGQITINKKVINITTFSNSKTYDGNYYYSNPVFADIVNRDDDKISLESGKIETIVMTGYNNYIMSAGSYPNVVSLKVVDNAGNDTTGNYSFNYNFGTITINKLKVFINLSSSSKPYDGTPLTSSAWEFVSGYGVIESDFELKVETTGSITYYHEGINGTIQNGCEGFVLKVGGYNITENYDFEVLDYGTLTIIPQDVTIKIDDVDKTYDGRSLSSNAYTVINGYLYDKLSITTNGDITNVGYIENLYESHSLFNSNGVDVSSSYNITWESGTLTINPIEIEVNYVSGSKEYNGLPYYSYNDPVSKFITISGSLAEGEKLEIDRDTINLDIIDYNIDGYINDVAFKIVNANGVDVTGNYDIPDYEFGMVHITQIDIYIETVSDNKKIYDGNPYYEEELENPANVIFKQVKTSVGDSIVPTKWNYNMINADSYDNIVEYEIRKDDGSLSTHNYNIVDEIFGTITIQPKTISFNVLSNKEVDNVYNGKPYFTKSSDITKFISIEGIDHINSELIGDDYFEIDLSTINENIIDAGNYKYTIGLIIKDKNNYIVNSNYNIQCAEGEILIRKVVLDITTNNLSKEYDGTPFYTLDNIGNINKYITITNGELVENESIEIDFDKVEEMVEVKDYSNKLEFIFRKSTGDISDNYAVNPTYGNVSIIPITVLISLEYAEQEYNGKALTSDAWVYSHTLENQNKFVEDALIVLYTSGEIIKAGEVENKLDGYKIMLGNEDITHCYNIEATPNKLVVTPKALNILIKNESKEYDGTPLTSNAVNVEGLLDDDILNVITTGSVTNVSEGLVENGLDSCTIINKQIGDVYGCYTINVTPGTLSINQKEITVKSLDREKVYDGLEMFTFDSAISELIKITGTLAINEKVEIVKETIGQNIIDVYDNYTHEVHVVIKNGDVVTTSNYDIEYIPGIVKITPKVITFESVGDISVDYTGQPYYKDGDDESKLITVEQINWINEQLIEGHTFEIDYSTVKEMINANDYLNEFELQISDSNGYPVDSNYQIVCNPKTITINKKVIVINTYDIADKVYDGQPFYNSENIKFKDKYFSYDGLAADETIEIDLSKVEEMIDAKEYENKLEFIIKKNGVDVTRNYEFDSTNGTITIQPRPITIYTENVEKTYDGKGFYTVLEYNEGQLITEVRTTEDGDALLGEDYLEVVPGSYENITDAGENYQNKVLVNVRNSSGISSNYAIDYSYGTLTINKAVVIIRPVANVTYQGGLIDLSENYDLFEYVGDGRVGSVDELKVSITLQKQHVLLDESGNVSSYPISVNDFVVTINDEETPNNYIIYKEIGSLTINPLDITIVLSNSEKYYDGTELTFEGMPLPSSQWKYLYEDQYIYEGEESLRFETVGSITNSGSTTYNIVDSDSYKIIYNNNDYTNNYNINFIEGTLTVKSRVIDVTTKTGSKEYDGTPCFEAGVEDNLFESLIESFEVEGANVVGNKIYFTDVLYQTIEIEAIDIITDCINVGNYSNRIRYKIVDSNGLETTNNYIGNSEMNVVMEVTPKVIEYVAKSGNKTYDGNPYFTIADSDDKFIDELEMLRLQGLLINGHTLSINKNLIDTNIIDANTYINEIKFIVKDESDNDISGNYQFDIKDGTGVIIINKVKIIYDTNTDSKEYDGKSYYNETTIDDTTKYILFDRELLVGEDKVVIDLELTEPMINVGINYRNDVKFNIVSSGLVSNNYDIIPGNLGTITRTMTDLYITTVSDDSYVYNGTPYYSKDDSEDLSKYIDMSSIVGLIDGDEIKIVYESVDDMIDATNYVNDFSVIVLRDGIERQNYNIHITPGIISIKPLEITIEPDVVETYTGDFIDLSNKNANVNFSGNMIADIDELIVTVNLQAKFAGEHVISSADYEVSYRRKTGSTPNVQNYIINKADGILTINKADVEIELLPASKTYDGTPLTFEGEYLPINQWRIQNGEIYEGSENLKFNVSGKITDVDYTYYTQVGTPTILVDDIDYYPNYNITFIEGELRVNERAISITTKYGTKEYDGTPYYNELVDNPFDKLISDINVDGALMTSNSTFELNGENTIQIIVKDKVKTNVDIYEYSAIEELFEVRVINNEGIDVTDNYNINPDVRPIKIYPKAITYSTSSGSKDYNGLAFFTSKTNEEDIIINYESFINNFDGHEIKITYDTEMIDAGYYSNVVSFEVLREGIDVTGNYDFYCEQTGTITINKLNITLSTDDVTKVFDGLPYYDGTEDFNDIVTVSGLRVSDSIEFTYSRQDIDVYSSYEHEFDYIIRDMYGNDITNNYQATKKWGNISITPFEIILETEDKVFDYDGQEHNYTVLKDVFYDSLPSDFTISIDEENSAKISVPGRVSNIVKFDILDANGRVVKKSNYNIVSESYGTLEMYATVRIITEDLSKVFDFNKLEDERDCSIEVLHNDAVISNTMPTGHSLNVLQRNSITYVTESGADNSFDYEVIGCTNWSTYYRFRTNWGKLTVEKYTSQTIVIKASNQRDIFSGDKPTVNNLITTSGLSLGVVVKSYNCDLNETLSVYKVGTYEIVVNDIVFDVVSNGQNLSMTLTELSRNMEIDVRNGTFTITKSEGYIRAKDLEKTMDGAALTADNSYVTNIDESKFELFVVTSGSQSTIGSSEHVLESYTIYYNGVDVTDCFDIKTDNGTLTINRPR